MPDEETEKTEAAEHQRRFEETFRRILTTPKDKPESETKQQKKTETNERDKA